jgi:hypothetical protein
VVGTDGSSANRTKTGEDGQMSRFASVEELFNGRHFDQEIVVMRPLVPELQTELSRLGGDDE